VRLEVQDTGTGLTREECERLFTPYYTSKQHGTGLGLAIVQSVVSDHNARIRVASEPGMGTRFVIELPGPVTERAKLETRNSKIEAGETAAPGEEQVQEPPSERGGEISSEKKDGDESAPADH
jgi:hypothetical protein